MHQFSEEGFINLLLKKMDRFTTPEENRYIKEVIKSNERARAALEDVKMTYPDRYAAYMRGRFSLPYFFSRTLNFFNSALSHGRNLAYVIIVVVTAAGYCLHHLGEHSRSFTAKPDVYGVTLLPAGGGSIPIGNIVSSHQTRDALFLADSNMLQLTPIGGKGKQGWNTLVVPKGYTYSVRLPDGSVARLNSDSRIKFPSAFDSDKREVHLEGQAYFDITQDPARVFTIKTTKADILVLGTTLDVTTFDSSTRVLLVTGSVLVSSKKRTQVLTPGQAAIINNYTGRFTTGVLNIDMELSWLEGMYIFVGKSLEDICAVAQRWYDVEIIIDRPDRKSRYSGAIFQKHSCQMFLEALKTNHHVDYYTDQKGRVHLR